MSSSLQNSARSARPAEPASPFAGITPAFVLNVLRRWWMVVVPVGICLGAAGAARVYFTFVPSYMARTLIWIAEQDPYLVQPERMERSYIPNQLGLLRSSLVLGPAVSDPRISELAEIAGRSEPIEALRARIGVTRAWGTEHYYVTGVSTNPASAAAISNAVADAYYALAGEYRSGQHERLIRLLEQERAFSEREVERLRENVRQMTVDQTGSDPFTSHATLDRLPHYPMGSIHSQLTTLHVEHAVLRAQIAALEEYIQENPSGVDEAAVDQAVQQDARIRQHLAQLEQKRALLLEVKGRAAEGEASPRYQALKQEIAAGERFLDTLREELRPKIRDRLASTAGSGQRQRLAELRAREQELILREQALADAYGDEVSKLQQYKGADLALELKRAELARASSVLDRISHRMFMLRTEQRAPERVEILEKATIPTRPIERVPSKKLGVAFLAGFGVPFALAFLWDLRTRHVLSAEQLQEQTLVPVVGEIASLPMEAGRNRYFGGSRAGRSVRLFEESVEALRTCLVLTKSLDTAQVLAVVSAATQEGKSTLAAQLAISLARSGKGRTLLIDADMRAPNAHDIFELPNDNGLVEVLSGEVPLSQAVTASWDERLDVLPAGRLKSSPHKLVAAGALKTLLEEVRRDYRYIVFDTPPVLAAGEALVIAAAADAALVCTRRDVSRQDQVRKAHSRLAAAGANVIGSVFSGIPLSHYKYRYGGYYYGEER